MTGLSNRPKGWAAFRLRQSIGQFLSAVTEIGSTVVIPKPSSRGDATASAVRQNHYIDAVPFAGVRKESELRGS